MLDQKNIVQEIYKDMFNDPTWIERYVDAPDDTLDSYGLFEQNKALMKAILRLFS